MHAYDLQQGTALLEQLRARDLSKRARLELLPQARRAFAPRAGALRARLIGALHASKRARAMAPGAATPSNQ